MTPRPWLAPSPHLTAVLAWEAFLHALCDDHPHPAYSGGMLCQPPHALIAVDCGP